MKKGKKRITLGGAKRKGKVKTLTRPQHRGERKNQGYWKEKEEKGGGVKYYKTKVSKKKRNMDKTTPSMSEGGMKKVGWEVTESRNRGQTVPGRVAKKVGMKGQEKL